MKTVSYSDIIYSCYLIFKTLLVSLISHRWSVQILFNTGLLFTYRRFHPVLRAEERWAGMDCPSSDSVCDPLSSAKTFLQKHKFDFLGSHNPINTWRSLAFESGTGLLTSCDTWTWARSACLFIKSFCMKQLFIFLVWKSLSSVRKTQNKIKLDNRCSNVSELFETSESGDTSLWICHLEQHLYQFSIKSYWLVQLTGCEQQCCWCFWLSEGTLVLFR